MTSREKISLDKSGTLLRCIYPAKLIAPKFNKVFVQPGDIMMFVNCMYFSEPIILTKENRLIYPDNHLRNIWNWPKSVAILNFLYGEQILRIKFTELGAHPREFRKLALKESSLFTASFWLYSHFEVAKPNGA